MYIYSINNINFKADPLRKIIIDKELLNKYKNNAKSDLKKEFYSNIDLYVNKKYNKNKFLNNINELAKKIDNRVKFNDAEKQYIDDMLTTIDLSAKREKISDKYLLENINILLKNQQ